MKCLPLPAQRVSLTGIFAICGLLALGLCYFHGLVFPPIRADGVGYYAYLPATFYYHDLTLNRMVDSLGQPLPDWTGISFVTETQNYLIRYPMGMALLIAPFFLLAVLFCSLFQVDPLGIVYLPMFPDGEPLPQLLGFSWPFQVAFAIGGLTYGVIAFVLLWRLLSRYFARATLSFCLPALLFGTAWFHYSTYDNTFSHVYSLFLFSLFLGCVERMSRMPSPFICVLAGLCAGLIVLTRPTNIVWLIVGGLYGISTWLDVQQRVRSFGKNFHIMIWLLLPILGIALLQLFYWKVISGNWLVYTYGEEGFDFANPKPLAVLFSIKKGLFVWSPILLTLLPGLFFIRSKSPQYVWGIAAFLPLNLYIISAWEVWWYDGGFSHRPFLESLPIFAIALCSLYEGITVRWRWALRGFIWGTTAFSVWLMIHYWLGIIHYSGMSRLDLWRVLTLFHARQGAL